ncbi:hypothetical protein U1Q18_040337, partial [Sarracenia purpurea var. burkii]
MWVFSLSTSFQQDHLVATVSGFRGSVSSEIGSEGRRAVFAHALRRAWGKVMRRWADGAGGTRFRRPRGNSELSDYEENEEGDQNVPPALVQIDSRVSSK